MLRACGCSVHQRSTFISCACTAKDLLATMPYKASSDTRRSMIKSASSRNTASESGKGRLGISSMGSGRYCFGQLHRYCNVKRDSSACNQQRLIASINCGRGISYAYT